jgi:nicotinate-nucleotide pyrophosphorylase (carboxylating)
VKTFRPEFTNADRQAAERLIDLALAEDLAGIGDLTCNALIGESDRAEVLVVAREAGIVAGLPIGELVFAKVDRLVGWVPEVPDGSLIEPGQIVARAAGPLAGILIGERTTLNFVGHLSGIASLTHEFVAAASGTAATILDTRKTLPGWRSLAKYAVRAGGGTNHRMGLFDGVLVKDNHIAAWSRLVGNSRLADAVRQARAESPPGASVEFEVDTLEQLRDVLEGQPDIVLLDNMTTDQLLEAVRLRNETAPQVLLEASGGITLQTVRAIAETGVERISIGALTHSARCFDLGFDFHHIG